MRASRIWSFISTNLISLATIFVGVIVILLDQFGILPSRVVSSAILALLTLLATSEIIERMGKLSRIEGSLEDISSQLRDVIQGVNVQNFSTYDEAIDYLSKRTKEARHSIDQASIDRKRMSKQTPASIAYNVTRAKVILEDKIKYRYLAVLHDKRRLELCREWMIKHNLTNIFAGFYSAPSPEIPLLSFTIIDKEEVFIRYPYELGQDSSYIAIHSKQVANLFIGYFERLWIVAEKPATEDDFDRLLSLIVE